MYTVGTVTNIGNCREVVIAIDERGGVGDAGEIYKTVTQHGGARSRTESEIALWLLPEIEVMVGTVLEYDNESWLVTGKYSDTLDNWLCVKLESSRSGYVHDLTRRFTTAQITAAILAKRQPAQEPDSMLRTAETASQALKDFHSAIAGYAVDMLQKHGLIKLKAERPKPRFKVGDWVLSKRGKRHEVLEAEQRGGQWYYRIRFEGHAPGNDDWRAEANMDEWTKEKREKPCYVMVMGKTHEITGVTPSPYPHLNGLPRIEWKQCVQTMMFHEGRWVAWDEGIPNANWQVSDKHMRRACKKYNVELPEVK